MSESLGPAGGPPQFLLDFGQERKAFWADPPRGQCESPGCAEADAILHEAADGRKLCAGHTRREADRKRPYPCDNCGQDGAFRDPMHRRDEMLCVACHEATGYIPGERAMITKLAPREGVTHSLGRKEVCIAAGKGTECKGQVKQRSTLGLLCDRHYNPKKYIDNKRD